ncbi:gamma-glutamyl-gamma-aminobutyrate hydrolase family protein [Paraburkholderia tropica]|uniref:gamma-glutamyl-gamma-aminobutyrate hydrolase family protein n=1 Tax=Paraburkholderia tropica TaxID=92647 RepID=UPI0007EC97A5|nr:gamma-glutamyl-gamma-aminobutyrate hydrolase family protein [Paraburkholderia tropica]
MSAANHSWPVVAVSTDYCVVDGHPSHSVGDKYVAAIVEGANSLALLLPSLGKRQSIAGVLAHIDGLLFTGSYSNVDPRHYGGPPSAEGTQHDPARDATTIPLIKAAVAVGVPVLAICRGFQEMNVAFGGSLHQRVHETPGFDDHREDKSASREIQYGPTHEIRFTAGGMLQRIAGGKPTLSVNSLHGQGIDRLGKNLMVEAVAPDGLIEAISVADAATFAVGVQWHPEWRHAENNFSTALLRAFGNACRARKLARGAQKERCGATPEASHAHARATT